MTLFEVAHRPEVSQLALSELDRTFMYYEDKCVILSMLCLPVAKFIYATSFVCN